MKKKILIVDDVYSELQIIQNALEPLGSEIVTAMDGLEAEKKIIDLRPDAVVLDVLLPQKNGFQICRDIKSNPDTKDIPIILISSKNQDSDKFWGIFESVGFSELVVDARVVDEKTAIEMILESFGNRKKIENDLRPEIARAQYLIRQTFQQIINDRALQ